MACVCEITITQHNYAQFEFWENCYHRTKASVPAFIEDIVSFIVFVNEPSKSDKSEWV